MHDVACEVTPALSFGRSTPGGYSRGADEPLAPLTLVMAVVAAGQAALFIASILAQRPVVPMTYVVFGYDFSDFWNGARDMLDGLDPYARPRLVTPPTSILPFLPLASLSRPAASMVFFGLNVAAISAGLFGLSRRFRLSRQALLATSFIAVLSPSTLMLVDRGNIDGLVFLALSGFLLADERRAAPILLAAATCLKAYPAVFILALLAHRRASAAIVAGGLVIAAALVVPQGWFGFLHNQIGRAGGMRLDENLSPLSLLWFFGRLATGKSPGHLVDALMVAGALVYAAILVACLWLDRTLVSRLDRPNRTLLLASYAIFCIGMPSLVFLYSGVVLFLLLAALGSDGLLVSPGVLRRTAIALGCVMLPAKSFALTIGTQWAYWFNLVPPTAAFALLVYALVLRLDLRRALAARHAASDDADMNVIAVDRRVASPLKAAIEQSAHPAIA